MKTVLTIIKKEFARFFKDTRLWITALILPGLLIFAVYNIMGSIIESEAEKSADVTCSAYIENMSESQSEAFSMIFDLKQDYTIEEAEKALKEGKLDLIIVFPQSADGKIQIEYNSAESKSQTAYTLAVALVANYEIKDLADEQSLARTILSTIVPMVLLMLLFSGCMAVAPESIAGEKERGTIATLLVTPVKRSVIAVGKIAALSVIALLSGLSSALGMLLSLPKLAGSAGGGITFAMYGFGDYAAVLGVILSTVLVLVAIISIVSAFAKSVKEANGLVVPVMILVMLCGVFSMFATSVASIGLYFIPLFNSALVISTVLSGTVSLAGIAITVCVNVAFAALLVFVLTQMFKSERIMFNK